jgi:hypothetical protein
VESIHRDGDAVVVVRDGQLVAVRSGQAKVDGTVTVEGVEIGRKTITFPLTAELALRSLRDTQGPLLTSEGTLQKSR